MLSFLFSPGKEQSPGTDFCKLHLQLLPGRSPQLFCFRGPDDGLFPPTPGEPGHCGPTSHCCHHPGCPGRTAGTGLGGALRTVRTVWAMGCTVAIFMCRLWKCPWPNEIKLSLNRFMLILESSCGLDGLCSLRLWWIRRIEKSSKIAFYAKSNLFMNVKLTSSAAWPSVWRR